MVQHGRERFCRRKQEPVGRLHGQRHVVDDTILQEFGQLLVDTVFEIGECLLVDIPISQFYAATWRQREEEGLTCVDRVWVKFVFGSWSTTCETVDREGNRGFEQNCRVTGVRRVSLDVPRGG